MRKSRLHWILLVSICAFAFIVRLQMMDVPLERDEGEYAYAAQLLLDGVPPFKEAYNMKFPGIYAVYAAILFVFGQTGFAIHLALALVNAATCVLVFLVARRLFSPARGLAAALMFAMLSALPAVQGIMANSEHFVIFFALAGTLALMRAKDDRGLLAFFIAGALFGAGYTIKQHGAAFVLFGYLLIALDGLGAGAIGKAARRSLAFTAGAAAPFIVMCALLLAAGVFDRFWFWTFSYAREYVSVTPFAVGMGRLWREASHIFMSAPVLWTLSAIGVLAPLLDRSSRRAWPVMAGLLLFSAMAVVPGFFFRPHYFIYVIPAAALSFAAFTGAAASFIDERKRGLSTLVLCVVLAACFVYTQRTYLASAPDELSRRMYGYNPFPEALVIAEHIERDTAPGDRIAVLGSEPEIYFYSKRRSATGFIYTYALMEKQRFALDMQRKMFDEVRGAAPAYAVFVDVKFSWGANDDSALDIFEWLKGYISDGYTLVGIVDLKATGGAKYAWGDEVETARAPEPGYGIYVYRRD